MRPAHHRERDKDLIDHIRTSRRGLLRLSGLALGAAALAACGQPLPTPVVATPTSAPAKPTEAPKPVAEPTKPAAAPAGATTPAAGAAAPASQATTAPAAAKPATGGTAQITLRMHARTDAEGTKP
jgi:hypothetical protein